MTTSPREVLIVGCGDLGRRIATRLVARGDRVTGTARSGESLRAIHAVGARSLSLDVADGSPLADTYDDVVYAVAAGRGGDGRTVYEEGPRRLLERLPSPPVRLLFISSTSVYAQRGGEEVDEASEAASEDGNAPALRAGEAALRQATPPARVLRLGGLYGPGRSPVQWVRNERFRAALSGAGDAWMNWIHVEDAADAAVTVLDRGEDGEIYLGVDGAPITRRELWETAARLAGVEPPHFSERSSDRGKICRSARLATLGFRPTYADIRIGLSRLAEEPS